MSTTMSEQTSEALRVWFKRVELLYPELFNTAHAICGNYDQAEYALRGAILDIWAENADGGMGFREKLRAAVREEAFEQLNDDSGGDRDFTWPGFSEVSEAAIQKQLTRESVENQRVLMLKHGVGLTTGRIARLTGQSTAQVRSVLERFERRCKRGLSAQERGRFDALFGSIARRQLNSRAGIPHPASVYRAFEAEASRLEVPEHKLSKVILRIVVFLMALVCAVLFWVFAVLVQSPSIEKQSDAAPPPQNAEVETVQASEGYYFGNYILP